MYIHIKMNVMQALAHAYNSTTIWKTITVYIDMPVILISFSMFLLTRLATPKISFDTTRLVWVTTHAWRMCLGMPRQPH